MTTASQHELDELVREVADPELPHVTIGDLGIVRSVAIDGTTARVALTPTYTGCPATEQIRDDVETAVRRAGFEPEIDIVLAPAWSSDWITDRGRGRLSAAGITPPPPVHDGAVAVSVAALAPCPRCGSRSTRLVTEFGSTACKASYVCRACSEPFEAFKAI